LKHRTTARLEEDPSLGTHFVESAVPGSLNSARAVVPLVIDLLGEIRSVVDVGCGTGAWLTVFSENGVDDCLGLDLEYVRNEQLLIPPDWLRITNLTTSATIERTFELVVCLEVAEHLPASSADNLIERLVALGTSVLFSAAIPFQGGRHHINEQWPEYWAAKFRDRGYEAFDPFRRAIWDDERVEPWYRQNLVLYLAPQRANELRSSGAGLVPVNTLPSVVHPRLYLPKARIAARFERLLEQRGVRILRRVRQTVKRCT
jgi:hypothetical protein